jgi:hypothetical protein
LFSHRLSQDVAVTFCARILRDLSGFGLVNAATHYAEDVEDNDRATELDQLGLRLLELSAKEWKHVVEAQ